MEILPGADRNGTVIHRRWCLASEVEALVLHSGYTFCFMLVGLLVIRKLNGNQKPAARAKLLGVHRRLYDV